MDLLKVILERRSVRKYTGELVSRDKLLKLVKAGMAAPTSRDTRHFNFIIVDDEAIIKAAEETGAIVTAENNSIIGGLGEAVAAVLCENIPTPIVRVGIDDEFSQSGKITPQRDDIKLHFGLAAEDLALSVKECIAKKEALRKRNRK